MRIPPVDPFAVKRHSRLHPWRIAFVAASRGLELWARHRFEAARLPTVPVAELEGARDGPLPETSVGRRHLAYLRHFLARTEALGGAAVELGAFRGATCAALAPLTRRPYVVVDPYIGYGGVEHDLERLRERTAGLANVVHERATSGAAARAWRHGPVSFLFVDAVHDFVNTSFDLAVWEPLCVPGAVVALHDTDTLAYAGTRLAARRWSRRARLLAHVDDLVVLERPAR